MKVLKFFVVGLLLAFVGTTSAQLSVSINIGNPPSWGPSGYDNVRYYYLPDVEAYYDVQNARFIYLSSNIWVQSSKLPSKYKNYDLYGGYKVVLNDYRGNSPYSQFSVHKVKYKHGYRGKHQVTMRDYQKGNSQKPNSSGKKHK